MSSTEQAMGDSIREQVLGVFGRGFCNMTPKTGSVVAGFYMIFMTNMFLIFETGHLNRSLSFLEKNEPDQTLTFGWIIPYCYYTSIALSLITFPITIFFIYSIYRRDTVGIFVYLGWVAFYDISNCVIITLTSMAAKTSEFNIHYLEWFGLTMRIVVDCFWVIFIITYALLIIEGRQTGQTTWRDKQSARRTTVTSRCRLGIREKRIE